MNQKLNLNSNTYTNKCPKIDHRRKLGEPKTKIHTELEDIKCLNFF